MLLHIHLAKYLFIAGYAILYILEWDPRKSDKEPAAIEPSGEEQGKVSG